MQRISIVWFKRDLRVNDHAPLKAAIEAGYPVLAVTFLEPSLRDSGHYAERHWSFISQSVEELNIGTRCRLYFLEMEPDHFFEIILSNFHVQGVYSYMESGLTITYDRDKRIYRCLKSLTVTWHEFPYAGVIRGAKNRTNWRKSWYETMNQPMDQPDLSQLTNAVLPESLEKFIVTPWKGSIAFQKGGITQAHETLYSFITTRSKQYVQHISNLLRSRQSCSRLSPYLAWGNISMREVYQASKASSVPRAFLSRLRWHCHFIQKFESEMRYEEENINRGYDSIRKERNEDYIEAWRSGRTGFPLVDACVRAVKGTGYLNFRMRAMIVSFLTHHLWQDWRTGVEFLGRQFLDFEPGIHYPQFQMQAGVTGINTIRIYNPVKQSFDHDKEAEFIAEWVPELSSLPLQFRLEPWKMTPIEEKMYGISIGDDYPIRIVDHKESYRRATKELYRMKADATVKSEARRILSMHSAPQRNI